MVGRAVTSARRGGSVGCHILFLLVLVSVLPQVVIAIGTSPVWPNDRIVLVTVSGVDDRFRHDADLMCALLGAYAQVPPDRLIKYSNYLPSPRHFPVQADEISALFVQGGKVESVIGPTDFLLVVVFADGTKDGRLWFGTTPSRKEDWGMDPVELIKVVNNFQQRINHTGPAAVFLAGCPTSTGMADSLRAISAPNLYVLSASTRGPSSRGGGDLLAAGMLKRADRVGEQFRRPEIWGDAVGFFKEHPCGWPMALFAPGVMGMARDADDDGLDIVDIFRFMKALERERVRSRAVSDDEVPSRDLADFASIQFRQAASVVVRSRLLVHVAKGPSDPLQAEAGAQSAALDEMRALLEAAAKTRPWMRILPPSASPGRAELRFDIHAQATGAVIARCTASRGGELPVVYPCLADNVKALIPMLPAFVDQVLGPQQELSESVGRLFVGAGDVEVVFAIDTSPSMAINDPTRVIFDSLPEWHKPAREIVVEGLLQRMRSRGYGKARLAFIFFDTDVRPDPPGKGDWIEVPLAHGQDAASVAGVLLRVRKGLVFHGAATNIVDTLQTALARFRIPASSDVSGRYLYVLTDGADTHYVNAVSVTEVERRILNLAEELRGLNPPVTINSIGLRGDREYWYRRLGKECGALRRYMALGGDSLPGNAATEDCQTIALRLKAQAEENTSEFRESTVVGMAGRTGDSRSGRVLIASSPDDLAQRLPDLAPSVAGEALLTEVKSPCSRVDAGDHYVVECRYRFEIRKDAEYAIEIENLSLDPASLEFNWQFGDAPVAPGDPRVREIFRGSRCRFMVKGKRGEVISVARRGNEPKR